MSRPLVTLYSGDLLIRKSQFSNISGTAPYQVNMKTFPAGEYENSLFYVNTENESSVNIIESLFQNITHQMSILSVHPSSINFCVVAITDSIFKENLVASDYFGHYYAFLVLSNNQFLNSVSTQGLFLLSTAYISIENTIWDNYTVAVSVICKIQSHDLHNSISNITMTNIDGGCIYISDASSPVIVINSRFENISHAGYSCILLTARQQYLFRNNIFENCSGQNAAVVVQKPDGVSVFESLTFINNEATSELWDISLNYADLILVNPGFPNSEIIVNGSWYIVGSRIKNGLASSMSFQLQVVNKSAIWTINMNNWMIKNIETFPAIWLDGVNVNIDNLFAENNSGVFIVSSVYSPDKISTHSVVNSYFSQNQNTVMRQWNMYGWHSSTILFKNNTFYLNKGAIFEILTANGTINMDTHSKKLCVNETHAAMTNHCNNNNIPILSLIISNITDIIHGSWWGCSNFKCYLKNFELQKINATELVFMVDNLNASQYPAMYWGRHNHAIFENCYSNNFQHQYIFDNVTAYFENCILQRETEIVNNINYGMFQATNNASLYFNKCIFKHNQISLINASQSTIEISNSKFINNTGNNRTLSLFFMIFAQSSFINISNSLFEDNHQFSAIIKATHSVDLFILNSTFSNGTSTNSIDIMGDGNVFIQDSEWNGYNSNIITQHSQNYTNIIFINNTMANITGRGIFIEGELTTIYVAESRLHNITAGCIILRTNERFTVINTTFDHCVSTQNGGGIMISGSNNITVKTSEFIRCSAEIGGAIYVLLNDSLDSSINIEGTRFYQNEASVGSAMYVSKYELIIISEPKTINISLYDLIKDMTFNMINLDNNTYAPTHIFVALLPHEKDAIDKLKWSSFYQWSNEHIHLSNNLQSNSIVDDSSFISSLFIPMKMQSDINWIIDSGSIYKLQVDFTNFLLLLMEPVPLTFDIVLIAYNSNPQKTHTSLFMRMNDILLQNNYAHILTTIFMNADPLQSLHLVMLNSTFQNNIASGLSSLGVVNYDGFNDNNNTFIGDTIKCTSNIAQTSCACFGIFGLQLHLTFNDCLFSSNYVQEKGAAVFAQSGLLTLRNTSIVNNTSPLGGNVLLDYCKLTATHCVFTANKAETMGGAAIEITNIHKLINDDFDFMNYSNLISVNNSWFIDNEGANGALYIPITHSFDASNNENIRFLLSMNTSQITQNQCEGIAIIIDPHYHPEDISWTLQFDNDSTNILQRDVLYSCITNVPVNTRCITFTIYDSFGDGLNYGQGSYTIKWNNKQWHSLSSGNFGENESFTMCKTTNTVTKLEIFSILGDISSYKFITMLENILLPALDNSLRLIIVLQTYRYDEQYVTRNPSSFNCVESGYCVNNATHNVTMVNIISTLCYTWTLQMQWKYNYSYSDFWFKGKTFNDLVIENECFLYTNSLKTGSLLQTNYALESLIDTKYFVERETGKDPNPFRLNSTMYDEMVSQIMVNHYSHCDLYSTAMNIIDPICKKLSMNSSYSINPTLCQAKTCYSSYCDSTKTYLSVTTNNHDYHNWNHIHYAGSKMFNIPYLAANIYGVDEYLSSVKCFEGSNMEQHYMNNTIALLFGDIVHCNYNMVIEQMQENGVRAILIATNMSETFNDSDNNDIYIPVELVQVENAMMVINKDSIKIGMLCNTESPTSSPTPSPTPSPTSIPTQNPTNIPTIDPTFYPTPNPVNAAPSEDKFVIFTYQDFSTQFQNALTFSRRHYGEFMNLYQNICQLEMDGSIDFTDDQYVYFITINTIFEPFDNICVQFDDDSKQMIFDWSFMNSLDKKMLFISSLAIYSDNLNDCYSNKIESRFFMPTVHRGTYCFVTWTNGHRGKKQYNIIIKKLLQWSPYSFINIFNSRFIGNKNLKHKGGAISIVSDSDIYEFTSISIRNTRFDSNFAIMGGGAIYRGFPSMDTSIQYLQMNTLELYNIVMYNNNYLPILCEPSTSVTNKNIFTYKNAIYIQNMTMVNKKYTHFHAYEQYGGTMHFYGANVYIKDSNILNGTAYNGGCIWINYTSLILYQSVIAQCTSDHNGAGLFVSRYNTDLCVSIYFTTFSDNYAANDGAAAFIEVLRGNESCVNLYDVRFDGNIAENKQDDSFYLYVFHGDHPLLNDNTVLSHICDDCLVGSNTLKFICVSVDISECTKYFEHNGNMGIINVSASSVTLYLFGYNAFGNLLKTKYYSVSPNSNESDIFELISAPIGTYYIVPLKIHNYTEMATIVFNDDNKVAPTKQIQLRITKIMLHPLNIHVVARWSVILLALLSVSAVVFVIIFIIIEYRKYMDAYIIKRVLVLIIGITKFDNKKLNLPDDKNNISKLIDLWSMYNYDVRICNNNKDQFYCTKPDVINFVDKYKENVVNYDAVIVHILTHGQNGKQFQTSDGKFVKLGFINHELIEASVNVCTKIIFYHACRGGADYHDGKTIAELRKAKYSMNKCECKCCFRSRPNKKPLIPHNQSVECTNVTDKTLSESNRGGRYDCDDMEELPLEANCVTVFGNIDDRTQSTEGYFTTCICEVFESNVDKIKKKDFVELLIGENGLGRRLAEISNNAAICTTEGIGTLIFGKPIRFERSDTIGTVEKKNQTY
eukprot:194053_1